MAGLLRIATRRSQLALAQSRWVQEQLQKAFPGLEIALCEYVTLADESKQKSLGR